jgi:hypothetical protein
VPQDVEAFRHAALREHGDGEAAFYRGDLAGEAGAVGDDLEAAAPLGPGLHGVAAGEAGFLGDRDRQRVVAPASALDLPYARRWKGSGCINPLPNPPPDLGGGKTVGVVH